MVELSLEPSEDLEVDLGSSSDDEMEQESSSGSEEESGEGTEPSSSEEEDEDDDMSDCSEEEADSMDLKPAAKSSLAKQTTQAKPQRKPPPKQPPKAKVAAIPKALPKTAPKVALPKPKAVEQKPAAPADEDDAAVQECSSPRDAENQDCHEEVGLMVERGSGRAQVDDADDDALPLTAQEQEQRRDANIRALVEGSLDIHRKSMMPKLLTVQDAAAVTLRRPFKSPHPNAPARSHVRCCLERHNRLAAPLHQSPVPLPCLSTLTDTTT